MRLCPLLRAVPLSHASRPSCGGIRRLSGLGGGEARFWPPVGGCGPGVRRRRYEHVYPAQVWDPHAPLGRLVGVEPPDPRFNEVVRDLCPGGDERLELSHKDLGCRGMSQGDYGEKPVRDDVTEVFPEGGHQLARGRGSVDVVERPQFRFVEGTRAPLLWWSGGRGGHGHPVLVQCRVSRGGCREVAPGCPPGTYSVGGSRCRGIEQGVAVGSGPAGSSGLEVPVISVFALGPLPACPGCRDVPSVAWRLLDCGEGCPPAPCAGLGSGAGSLGRVSVACGPLGSVSAADPGGEAADELDVSPAVWPGSA